VQFAKRTKPWDTTPREPVAESDEQSDTVRSSP